MALRTLLISDLHIEHDPESLALELTDVADSHVTTCAAGEVDLIVVPGDIDSFRRPGPLLSLLKISDVLACLGNHDFWGTSLPRARDEWDRIAAYVNRRAEILGLPGRLTLFTGPGTAVIRGVRFIVATLWTNLDRNDPLTRIRVASAINDFTRIEDFNPDVWLAENERDFAYISSSLAVPHDGPTVVVTHHAPSRACLDPRYQDGLGGAGASDYDRFLIEAKADYWFHGHVHHSLDLPGYAGPRLICNPRGYRGGNLDYNPGLIIEI